MDELTPLPSLEITHRIQLLRHQRVMLDADLAEVYGVTTKRLNEAVRRNLAKFPVDFMFQTTAEEFGNLRSQIATSSSPKQQHGGRRYLPSVFTEHGALMVASILNSPRAIDVSVYIIRAFVELREASKQHSELAHRLSALEEKTARLSLEQGITNQNTHTQLQQVFDALRDLMTPPDVRKRPIGFIHTQ